MIISEKQLLWSLTFFQSCIYLSHWQYMHMNQAYLLVDIVLFSQTRQTHIVNLKEPINVSTNVSNVVDLFFLCDQPLSICVTIWVAALGQHWTAPSYFSKGSSHTERYSHAQSETCEAEKSSENNSLEESNIYIWWRLVRLVCSCSSQNSCWKHNIKIRPNAILMHNKVFPLLCKMEKNKTSFPFQIL